MTNPPGDGPQPHDPSHDPHQEATPGPDQPGYWEQQAQQSPGYGYGYPPHPRAYPSTYAPEHPRATMVLVLGILGVVICQVLGPFAWVMGKRTLDEIDASQGRLGGRGLAQAGYILGIVGTILLVLSVLFVVAYLVFAVVLIGGGMATST